MYEPEGLKLGEVRPLHFHIYGGGFVGGSAGMDALWLRSIVKELGVVVADADYRLAPEFPAPIPGNDAWAVFNFVISSAARLRCDASRIIIGGISAGVNLASGVALRAA